MTSKVNEGHISLSVIFKVLWKRVSDEIVSPYDNLDLHSDGWQAFIFLILKSYKFTTSIVLFYTALEKNSKECYNFLNKEKKLYLVLKWFCTNLRNTTVIFCVNKASNHCHVINKVFYLAHN